MRLAIADPPDPPYPPFVGSGGRKRRASRWYGDAQIATSDRPADVHPHAAEWDAPERHRQLLRDLLEGYDGFAIATAPDGIAAYGDLPGPARIMAWVKPNAQPGAHRLLSKWEAVILYPPAGRRSNRGDIGAVSDVLIHAAPGGFIGAKPARWVEWVCEALTYDPAVDTLDDLFHRGGFCETPTLPSDRPPLPEADQVVLVESLGQFRCTGCGRMVGR